MANMMNHPDLVYFRGRCLSRRGNDAGAEDTLTQIEFSSAMTSALQSIADVQIDREYREIDPLLERARLGGEIEHDEERISDVGARLESFHRSCPNDLAVAVLTRRVHMPSVE